MDLIILLKIIIAITLGITNLIVGAILLHHKMYDNLYEMEEKYEIDWRDAKIIKNFIDRY